MFCPDYKYAKCPRTFGEYCIYYDPCIFDLFYLLLFLYFILQYGFVVLCTTVTANCTLPLNSEMYNCN